MYKSIGDMFNLTLFKDFDELLNKNMNNEEWCLEVTPEVAKESRELIQWEPRKIKQIHDEPHFLIEIT